MFRKLDSQSPFASSATVVAGPWETCASTFSRTLNLEELA